MPAPIKPQTATIDLGETLFNELVPLNIDYIGDVMDYLESVATINNLSTTTTATNSNNLTTGSKTFTVPAGMGFVFGMPVRCVNSSSPLNYANATVTSYSGTTLQVNFDSPIVGSGTGITTWTIFQLNSSANTATLAGNSFSGLQLFAQGADIPTATTINLDSATGNCVALTGNVTVGVFTLTKGFRYGVITGTPLLQYNVSTNNMNTNGQNYQCLGGELYFAFVRSGAVYVILFKPDGTAISITAQTPSVRVRQTVSKAPVGGTTSTVTISNASPGVITYTAHGLEVNTPISFTTSGGLPAGLSVATQYYIKTVLDANTFTVSTTPGGAVINTSSAGSGTHTLTVGILNSACLPVLGGALGGTTFTTSNVSASNPLVATAANGSNVNGDVNVVGIAIANLTWNAQSSNGTWGIYADIAGGVITPVNACYPLPIYQEAGNYSVTANQFTFSKTEWIGKVGNGSAAVQANRVCLGQVTIAGGVVTDIKWYACNRKYDSGYTATLPNVAGNTTRDSNLGVETTNKKITIKCITTDASYAVGDTMTWSTGGNYNGPAIQPGVDSSLNQIWFTIGGAGGWNFLPKGGGASVAPTLANWAFKLSADESNF